MNSDLILKNYENAKEIFKSYGVDVEGAIRTFESVPISLHCWQGDDVKGFEGNADFSQNLVTGNYPGAARNGAELRSDIDKAMSMSPTKNRVNIHSIYQESNGKHDRNEVGVEDFRHFINWAKEGNFGLDFNVSFFTHKRMNNGFSLSSPDKATRDYWIKAGKGGRIISNQIGIELNDKCYNNIWIPDGLKDMPANRFYYRDLLEDSLNQIFEQKLDEKYSADVLEGKLFGIGTECFVAGSHEFYLGYAIKNGVGICMDTGHYLPTETIIDKISSVKRFTKDILIHISRGIRWDSDHVLVQGDDLTNLLTELKRGELLNEIPMGLDYFDASINRVGAWTIGLRAFGKSLINALLEPTHLIFDAEKNEDFTSRLALMDEFKNLPVNAVWDYVCLKNNAPIGKNWIDELKKYEREVQMLRK